MTETVTDTPRNDDGFTLVEMLAVLAIIAVLATAAVLTIGPQITRSKLTRAQADINTFETAIETYNLTMGQYPESLQDLVTPPRDSALADRFPRDGFVKNVPQDPWNRDYVYLYPGENRTFDLATYGADGEEGGEGESADVTNWTR